MALARCKELTAMVYKVVSQVRIFLTEKTLDSTLSCSSSLMSMADSESEYSDFFDYDDDDNTNSSSSSESAVPKVCMLTWSEFRHRCCVLKLILCFYVDPTTSRLVFLSTPLFLGSTTPDYPCKHDHLPPKLNDNNLPHTIEASD